MPDPAFFILKETNMKFNIYKLLKKINQTLIMSVILFFGIIFITNRSSAIELNFDDEILQCFPCANYSHYDVWFNAWWNDFDWIIIRSGIINLDTWIILEFNTPTEYQCPLLNCQEQKIICHKQIVWLYYNKARWERIWPLDYKSLELLRNPACNSDDYQTYNYLEMTWWRYTDCTWYYWADTEYYVNPYWIYWEIRQILYTWALSWETFKLYAWMDYDVSSNTLIPDSYKFINNIQFIPQFNKPISEQYRFYTWGLQWILFDSRYWWIGFIWDKSCIMPWDWTIVKQWETITWYWHNDKIWEEPVLDYAILQCANWVLEWKTWYIYSTPLDCYTIDWVTIPHNSGIRMFKNDLFSFSDRDYVYNASWYVNLSWRDWAEFRECRDWYLKWDSEYQYAKPKIMDPQNCYFPETDKFIKHNSIRTGYKFLSTDYETSWNCNYWAVFQCFDWNINLISITRLSWSDPNYNTELTQAQSEREKYKYDTCTVLEPKQCITPRWEVVENWNSIIAYKKNEVIQWQWTCEYQTRTCNNWILSWDYQYQACQEIEQDKIPDPIFFIPQSNVNLSTMIKSNDQEIKWLDDGIEVNLDLENTTSWTLIKNNIEVWTHTTVKKWDIVSVKLLSSNEYDTTTTATINLGWIKTLFAVTTKKNTDKTFTDTYPKPRILSDAEKFLIFKEYMNLLKKYESKAYDMCKVTESLKKIIWNKLFEINKNLITTSSFELKNILYFKKQVLEYLLSITDNYRKDISRKVLVNSAWSGNYIEILWCNR